jgi:hypothetical protein
MGSSFRRPYPLKVRPALTWGNDGLPVVADPTPITFKASIQPKRLTVEDENVGAPIGADLTRIIRIYTDRRLNVMDGKKNMPGDLVQYFGNWYVVYAESIYQAMGTSIDHFRYWATPEELKS